LSDVSRTQQRKVRQLHEAKHARDIRIHCNRSGRKQTLTGIG
jgi:hypothetical protein